MPSPTSSRPRYLAAAFFLSSRRRFLPFRSSVIIRDGVRYPLGLYRASAARGKTYTGRKETGSERESRAQEEGGGGRGWRAYIRRKKKRDRGGKDESNETIVDSPVVCERPRLPPGRGAGFMLLVHKFSVNGACMSHGAHRSGCPNLLPPSPFDLSSLFPRACCRDFPFCARSWVFSLLSSLGTSGGPILPSDGIPRSFYIFIRECHRVRG